MKTIKITNGTLLVLLSHSAVVLEYCAPCEACDDEDVVLPNVPPIGLVLLLDRSIQANAELGEVLPREFEFSDFSLVLETALFRRRCVNLTKGTKENVRFSSRVRVSGLPRRRTLSL